MIFFTVWGSRLFGKCDEVPGLFHVATEFVHFCCIPLAPMASHVVLGQTGNAWNGVPCGLSGKSVLIAWLRAALMLAFIVLALAAWHVFLDPVWRRSSAGYIILAIALGAMALLIGTYYFKPIARPSYTRARQLAEQIGLSEHGKILLDLSYGVISQHEATAAMEALTERAENENVVENALC